MMRHGWLYVSYEIKFFDFLEKKKVLEGGRKRQIFG
jgi:hypothetical protein